MCAGDYQCVQCSVALTSSTMDDSGRTVPLSSGLILSLTKSTTSWLLNTFLHTAHTHAHNRAHRLADDLGHIEKKKT